MLQTTHSDDPNVQEKIDKLAKRDRKTEQFFRWALKIMEWIIAGITLIALVGALGIEVVNMVTEGTAYFADVSHMLHNLLSIVVGLEFVRMLIDTTPANILEVLGYTMNTGVLPVGRFPNVAKRSSCELGSLGSYFFLLSCIWMTREIIATMTMQKANNASHVTIFAIN